MTSVGRKTFLKSINGTPKKRVFLSIISDYGLKTGVCELIDNALDLWTINDRAQKLRIDITLDVARQLIYVSDNAGGVKEQELELLIAPGAGRDEADHHVIGIFGVGGKRASVALGELIEIQTRYKNEKSLQLDITKGWLASNDWPIEAYQIPDIAAGTTKIEISKLRQPFAAEHVDEIRTHLGETYSWFINQGCKIVLNGKAVTPISFDAWAYPPQFGPRQAVFTVSPDGKGQLSVAITAGLIRDRDPVKENYGVYVYCNNRLIVKELRNREVGYFISAEAGVPHPDASLCRLILRLEGPPGLMPWNSSKSGINFNHPAFSQLSRTVISLVSYFSKLSRRLKTDWPSKVYNFSSGTVEPIAPSEILVDHKIVLPELPRVHQPPYMDRLKSANKKTMAQSPWTVGLIEAMGLVDLISRQHAETRTRAALILLDSNIEIALKEFIVNNTSLFPPHTWTNTKIAGAGRHAVITEVAKHVPALSPLLAKINFYYGLRNSFIHQRASVSVTDAQITDCRKVVEKLLRQLFGVKFPD